MEAVPRLPMLSIELKVCPENSEFGSKLKQYIRDFYHEDPDSYTNEIHELEGLRASAIRVSKDVDGCALLKRYFCQLHFLQSRFPIQEDGAAAVPYYWQDNYSNVVYCTTSINYELASILHNIGALHTQLGATDARTTGDGMKMSCSHFQCAAWCFQHLKDSLPRPRGTDMAPDFMQLYHQICLAQAQECILEKSMMDNRKSTIIAKVAAHVVEYYNLALEALTKNSSESGCIADTVGSKQYKSWQRYLSFKAAYHSCVMLLYQGQSAEEQQKMGERLAFYQAAADKLVEAAKLSKGLDNSDAVADALQFTQDVVEGKRKAAHNDNEFIYHEKVPERDTLPTLKGASLVKGMSFGIDDPDVSGPDIFAKLVPLRAHEASSLYSEEKAKLLRRVGTQVDEKDTELAAFMTSLQLESLNLHGASGDQLPQELVDACADLSERPESIGELVEAMDKLAETYHDVEGMLQDIDELLKEEESKEQSWRSSVGVARPPSIAATELTREAGKYREAHTKAGESNQTLHRAMALHVANLRTLSRPLPELAQQLPPAAGVGAETEEDKAAIAEVSMLVGKVREMSTQRAMLISQLRDAVLKDDITGQLVTSAAEGGVLDVVFDKEISKHNPQVAIIEQNLSAQANILRALTDAYARYAPVRKAASSASRKRQATISALLASYSAREDLLAKAGKGLEFYRKLESSVSRLLARVRSVCRVQEEERQQQQQATAKPAVLPTPESSPQAPKLKDYLQNMKHNIPSAYIPAAVPAAPFYGSHPAVPNPAAGTAPNAAAYPPPTTSSSEVPQWPTSARPTPVGSEGTDTSVCSKPAQVPAHMQDILKPNNLPYNANQYQYYQQDAMKSQQYPGYYPTSQAPLTYTNNAQSTQVPQNSYTNPTGLLPKVNNMAPQNYQQPYNSQQQYPAAMSTYANNQAVTTTTHSSNYQAPSNVGPSNVNPQYYQQPYAPSNQQPASSATSVNTTTYSTPTPTNPGQNNTSNPQQTPYSNQAYGYTTPTKPQAMNYSTPSGQTYQYPHSTPSSLPQSTSQPQATPTYPTSSQSNVQPAQSQAYSTPQSPSNAYGQQQNTYSTPMPNVSVPTTQTYPAQPNYSTPNPNVPTTQGYTQHQNAYSTPMPNVSMPTTQAYPTQPNYSTSTPNVSVPTTQSYPAQPYYATSTPNVSVPTTQAYPSQPSYSTPMPNASVPTTQGYAVQPGYATPKSNVSAPTTQTYPTQPYYATATSNASLPTTQSYSAQTNYAAPASNVSVSTTQAYPTQPYYSTPTSNVSVPNTQAYPSQPYYATPNASVPTTQGYAVQPGYTTPKSNVSVPSTQAYPAKPYYATPTSNVQTTQAYSAQTNYPAASPSPQAMNYPSPQGYGAYAQQYPANQGGLQQQYNIPSTTPGVTQGWSGDAYSSSPHGAVPSQYTSAGRQGTQQTNTSQTAVGGQTYAAQYNASIAATTAVTPSTYYSAPYYGYQYPTTGNMAHPASPQVAQQMGTPQNITYIQARMPESMPHTTYCGSPQQSSNMDLLSGLDFNVSQPPLQPVAKPQPVPVPVPVSAPQLQQNPTPSPAKVTPQQPSVIETPTPVSASPAPVLPAPTPTPTASSVDPTVLSSPLKLPQQSKEANKDPYAEPEALNQFVQDVERLEKVVEGLTHKTLNGPTPLDLKWKELQELQEKDVHKRSISVARCYPMKNRFPDILPYDHSRVELPSTKDDYINASHIKNLTPLSPDYIMTQAPLPSTYVDFWTMVWEQQTELVVCLLSDTELQGHVYWPAQKGEEMSVGKIRLSLQTVNVKSHWTERLITLVQAETRIKRVIVHLQFTTWPGSSFPASPSGFLSFVSEGLSQHAQQRSCRRPVVVHCLSGVGRSGLFCLVSSVMVAIRAGQGLLDLITVAATMGQQRRGALRDRQHLLFAFQAVLYHCQDLLMKRGILTSRSTFDDALAPRTHARHPSEDFLLGPGSLSQLQSGIEKMGLGSANIDWTVPTPVKPPSPTKPPTPSPAPETVSSLSDLAAFVPDPASLIAASASKQKARSSKEEFEARRGSISGSLRSLSPHDDSATNDPLSQLDPLWSLKHQ